ncbi:MAG: GGDEF domain-containing protein [Usitatibacter sp.]
MRILPSRARLAGLGLAIAMATIVALAILVLLDLERESQVHREVIAAQQAKDGLHALRTDVLELRAAARLGARTGDASVFQNIERRALDVESALAALEALAASGMALPALERLADSTRMLVIHARSIAGARQARGAESAAALADEAGRLSAEATASLDASLDAHTRRINERTQTALTLGEGLRKYIAVLLVGSIALLGGLWLGYRRVQHRERAAQKRIEHLAHFDLVTGLPNRALLADRLAHETARARRDNVGFAVLLCDLDGFKAVNDTWGHAAGDRVLALVGDRVRKCVRESDTVGRLGGDEFLAILPGTSLEGAVGVADKLRESLREPYALDGATVHLSTSVGLSLFPDHGGDPEQLQRAADAALYKAKREGKNRTVVAEAPRGAARSGAKSAA